MLRTLWKHNKINLLVIFLLAILFSLVMYLSGRYIYQSESDKIYRSTKADLSTAGEIVRQSFLGVENDLFFLRGLTGLRGYVESGLSSARFRDEIIDTFSNFAENNKKYYKIRIISASGKEMINVENYKNRSTQAVSETKLQQKKDRYYFTETMKLHDGEIFESPIDLDYEYGKPIFPYTPVVRIGTPLFDLKGRRQGVLILTLYFSHIMQFLPLDIAVQTPAGSLIKRALPDKIIYQKASPYVDLTGQQGWRTLSKNNHLFYQQIKFLSKETLYLVRAVDFKLLRAAMLNVVWLAVIFFVLFLILIFIILYRNLMHLEELLKTQKGIIYSLINLSIVRDKETGEHLERSRHYARVLATVLGENEKYASIVDDKFIEDIFEAAPLHDIGKVGIADSILLKPAKLTDEEFNIMKMHVQIGEHALQKMIDRLGKSTFLNMAKNICAYHHERYDGKGYMHGYAGDEIPLEARIFSLCDVYDALRSERHYKERMTHEEAVKLIKEGRGSQFDPDVVDVFLACNKEFDHIYKQFLS